MSDWIKGLVCHRLIFRVVTTIALIEVKVYVIAYKLSRLVVRDSKPTLLLGALIRLNREVLIRDELAHRILETLSLQHLQL